MRFGLGCYTYRTDGVLIAHLPPSEQVASGRIIDNLAAENPKLSLARLGIDALPEALSDTSSRTAHITMLDLKHNKLQLLPSELFMCLTQLEEVDISEVR